MERHARMGEGSLKRSWGERLRGWGVYLLASYLVALVVLASVSGGPLELFVVSIIPWGPAAILALALSGKQNVWARTVPPFLVLGAIAGLMVLGATATYPS